MSYLDKPATPGELKHFGVKGMKWGVHRRREKHAQEVAAAKERANTLGYFSGKPFTSPIGNAVGKTTKQVKREAAKAKGDAEEWARAKMYYGTGAGNRRKRIKAIIDSRSAGNPEYLEAFKKHLEAQDMEKHANKARSERRRTDVKDTTVKTARGVSHYVRGNPQYASAAAALLAGGALWAHRKGIDRVVLNAGKATLRNVRSANTMRKAAKGGMNAAEFLKNMGI